MKRLFGPRASTRGNTLVRRIVCAIALIVALTLAVAPLASQGMLPMRFAVHAQNHAQNADSSLAALNSLQSLQSPQSLQSDTANSTTSTAIAPAVSNSNTANSTGAIHATPIADTTPTPTAASAAPVDASDNGVTIKLFDYNTERYPRGRLTVPSINDNGHAMKFGDVYDTYNWLGKIYDSNCWHPLMDHNWNCWTGRPDEVAHPGIVANKLTGGYPTLNPTVTNSNESLDYLFGGATDKAVTQYPVSGGLLMLNSTGAYQFDSSKQYARYDSSTGRFVLTDGARNTTQSAVPNFTPFNKRSDTSYNYSFGMSIESKFYMPKDGKINGSDMVFTFSGDDDMWLFIDGALAIDLGGIHGDRGASIDFATGAITYEQGAASWWQVTRPATLSDALQRAGLTWDSSDFSQHTFKLFYLERGGGGSNCRMSFNLPTIPEGTLELGKTVDFGSAVPIDNTAFRFAAYLDYDGTESGSDFERFSGKYDVVDSRGASVASNLDATDGVITLHNGQVARLKAPPGKTIRANTRYYVTELGVDGTNYTASVSGMRLTREATGMSTPTLEVQKVSHLGFVNTVASGNTFTAYVAKQCSNCPSDTVNYMLVTIGGVPFSGAYTVSDATHTGSAGTTSTTTNGILTLKPGQTATIPGIVGGNSVAVREVDSTGAAFSVAGFKAPQYAMTGTALSGTASTPADGGVSGTAASGSKLPSNASLDVTVTNQAKSVQIGGFAKLHKTVTRDAGAADAQAWRDGDIFSFRLVPIDARGNESYGLPMPSECTGATAANPCTITIAKPAAAAGGGSNALDSATADFGTLTFVTMGTFRYRVTEVTGDTTLQQVYHYSKATYDIVVTVTDGAASGSANPNELAATMAVTRTVNDDGTPAASTVAQNALLEFTNTSFQARMLPLTGSRSEALWTVAAAVLAALTLIACLVYAMVRRILEPVRCAEGSDDPLRHADSSASEESHAVADSSHAVVQQQPEKKARR
ncbi:MAG: FctA domain-containing protein [Bifidobacteriaceae bacterium]|nr:FctA domain-containing protein [Bifidobacteriaceae bacterium]